MDCSIEVKNLSKTIKSNKILDDISFKVEKNSIFGIVGPNGAGKSTLLKSLVGLYDFEGSIIINGFDLKKDFEKAIEKVGSIIEIPTMYKEMSGYKNLEVFKMMFRDISEERIKDIVSIVNLENSIGKKFKTYSLGMKQRLGLAQALINKPNVLILDEPTNGLDPIGIRDLRTFLKDLKDTTIIISSHILNEIESLCDTVMFINQGKIIDIKKSNDQQSKKYINIKVDDINKAKEILEFSTMDEILRFHMDDFEISQINRKLVENGIGVYRIYDGHKSLEDDFFDKLGTGNV